MADTSPGKPNVNNEPYPAADLQNLQDLLKSKDNTTRFVGLAVLKSVLDNHSSLRVDPIQTTALWESISPRFLDRLLESPQNQKIKISKQEANNLVDIAVSVLHTFAIVLPEDVRSNVRMFGRIGSLVNALVTSSQETTVLILQTLLTFVSQRPGAAELLSIEDISPMTEIATQDPLVLKVIGLAWANCSTDISQAQVVTASMNKIIPSMLVNFKNTDAVTLLAFIADVIPKIPPEARPANPTWLPPLTSLLRKLIVSRPTSLGRSAYTEASSVLLQAYHSSFSDLLFDDVETLDSKPFSYLFVSLLLIDLRSSFSSLLSKLNDPEYSTISKRLAAAFDVVSAFIGVLLRSQDEEPQHPSRPLKISPEIILKLRKAIGETMSITIEYLRDLWDTVHGAETSQSTQSGTSQTSDGVLLTVTWDSIGDRIYEDELVVAALQTLSVWLREDDGDALRVEGVGLMDIFMQLYQANSRFDFKRPILMALEGITATSKGVESFISHNGWEVLSLDLDSIVKLVNSYTTSTLDPFNAILVESDRGTGIIRVMLAIVDHESITGPREDWMTVVQSASMMAHSIVIQDEAVMDFYINMLLLATALLQSASPGLRSRHRSLVEPMIKLGRELEMDIKRFPESVREQLQVSLDAAVADLEDLLLGGALQMVGLD